jgi:aerobic carbon-monoxide dehydrogenase large subunit
VLACHGDEWGDRHRPPLGAKVVGESARVGAPPAIANAVVDALPTHVDIPISPEKVWNILHEKGMAE